MTAGHIDKRASKISQLITEEFIYFCAQRDNANETRMYLMGKPYNGHALVDSQQYSAAQACSLSSSSVISLILLLIKYKQPILVAKQSKEWICGRSRAGIGGSNPAACICFL